jgi:hypothetical protein
MPYVSRAQEKFFNANRARLEAQGVNVGEWNSASKGLKLPERKLAAGKSNTQRPRLAARRQK